MSANVDQRVVSDKFKHSDESYNEDYFTSNEWIHQIF